MDADPSTTLFASYTTTETSVVHSSAPLRPNIVIASSPDVPCNELGISTVLDAPLDATAAPVV